MNVIALVDDIEVRIEDAELGGIGCHAHAGRWNAVAGQSLEVVGVGNTADPFVVFGTAAGACDPLSLKTSRVESRQTGANPSDLLTLCRLRQRHTWHRTVP